MASKQIDWEAIEREYRAGQLSVREIARQHGASHTAINKRAKADGWTKNLATKVREEVSNRLVSSEVATGNAKEAVEAAALRGVEVVRQHRTVIGRGRDLTLRLLDELDTATARLGELEEMIEAECLGDANSQRRNAMLRAVALPSRAGVIKDLSAAAKNWVALERQAFSLDDGGDPGEPATKSDVRGALSKLDQSQRDQLRTIAEHLAAEPGRAASGA